MSIPGSARRLSVAILCAGLQLHAFAQPAQCAPPPLPELRAQLAAAEADLVRRAGEARATRPAFESAYAAIERSRPTAPEARAAREGKLDELSPTLRRAFEAAVPATAAHQGKLQRYFTGYDAVATLRMDIKAIEVMGELDRARQELASASGDSSVRKLDRLLLSAREHSSGYWETRDILEGRQSYRRYMALRKMSEASRQAEKEIARLRGSLGAGASPTVKERWHAAITRMRRFWQNARLATGVNLPAARIVAYLANPLSKSDPAKVSDLLRGMGRTYLSRARVDLEVSGRENLPKDRKLIVTPTHRSSLVDPYSMMSLLSGPFTVLQTILWFPDWAQDTVKRLVEEEPGIVLAHTDGVDVIGKCVEAVRQGRTLLFFPEGNLPSPLGEVRRLRSGLETITERLLDDAVAIVPVTIVDPVDGWGIPAFGSAERELGMKVKITFQRPLDPRVVFGLSAGRDRLLVDLIRQTYHAELAVPARDAKAPVAVPEVYSGKMADPERAFSELHPE